MRAKRAKTGITGPYRVTTWRGRSSGSSSIPRAARRPCQARLNRAEAVPRIAGRLSCLAESECR
jgi:hypothetical protein